MDNESENLDACVTREVASQLERLVGQPPQGGCDLPFETAALMLGRSGIGYSQLNELLILLGFDRLTEEMFQFLVDGTTNIDPHGSIRSMVDLEKGVERFRKLALLLYGNVKYGFKTLSRDPVRLSEAVAKSRTEDEDLFTGRHDPILTVNPIPAKRTHLLGYIVRREIDDRLAANPADASLESEKALQQEVEGIGKANHRAYLASDHLDVYVATSMREEHEYWSISEMVNTLFGSPELRLLKLRYFDPTQAFCDNRIDKGLAEALMLKRSRCTVYLVGEADTLGKDSELASTLAQGKPVVAYVPAVDHQYAARLIDDLSKVYPGRPRHDLILKQIRTFYPAGAWVNPTVRNWVSAPEDMDLVEATRFLNNKIYDHYGKRAATLMEQHPLGIQVNLETGVANGVLVVRKIQDCAVLVHRILTRSWSFHIEDTENAVLLIEEVSGCVFRVMTRDAMLTNAYWNYYGERFAT